MRCTRCGHEATESDKFCAECGVFLRDAWVDHRLLLALTYDQRGDHRSARRELERLTESEPDHVLDLPHGTQLARAEHGAAVHRRG